MTMPSLPPPVPFLAASAEFKRATADTGTPLQALMEMAPLAFGGIHERESEHPQTYQR